MYEDTSKHITHSYLSVLAVVHGVEGHVVGGVQRLPLLHPQRGAGGLAGLHQGCGHRGSSGVGAKRDTRDSGAETIYV